MTNESVKAEARAIAEMANGLKPLLEARTNVENRIGKFDAKPLLFKGLVPEKELAKLNDELAKASEAVNEFNAKLSKRFRALLAQRPEKEPLHKFLAAKCVVKEQIAGLIVLLAKMREAKDEYGPVQRELFNTATVLEKAGVAHFDVGDGLPGLPSISPRSLTKGGLDGIVQLLEVIAAQVV
ncbi:MAG TPA: hypothetical protein VGI16_11345 [Candidatus Acidoferrum sp.]|jgi:hypothetical protein